MIQQTSKDTAALIVDPQEVAECAGLVYVHDEDPGIRRLKAGKGFFYKRPDGRVIKDATVLKRIRSLGIPPAYTDVWVCLDPQGHIQATGRDARGRKQYRYHPRWREVRDSTKFERMMAFAEHLPVIRMRVSEDMSRKGLPREKVLATVVHLLETTLIRVGNSDYARKNKSYGLTTLRNRHVAVEGGALRFEFKGKSGKFWKLKIRDRRIARVVKACQDLPGQHLFQYVDDEGQRHGVTSADVNAYLREMTGAEITAKDFRTWAGTVLAALALKDSMQTQSTASVKQTLRAAIEKVAATLGNTPAICRKCYIHPEILTCYEEGVFVLDLEAEDASGSNAVAPGLKPEEQAVVDLLKKRFSGPPSRPPTIKVETFEATMA